MFVRFGVIRKALMGVSGESFIAGYPPFGKERPGNPEHWERTELIVKVFIHAFCTMLEEPALWNARFIRDTMIAPFRGVSVEGLAAGLTVAEMTTPFSRGNRALDLADDLDGRHRILAYVGIGIGLGRLKRHPRLFWSKMRRETREWVLDGYGFSYGLFKRKRSIDQRQIPRRLGSRDLMMFDQGLGRVIWLTSGGDIHRVAATLRAFGDREQALWGGVGLACTYAGVSDQAGYEVLKQLAGSHYPALARGCAMACHQSVLDPYISDHSEMAAREFWDATVLEVAERATRHLKQSEGLSSHDSPVAYAYDKLERDALARVSADTRRETVHFATEQEIADG